MGGEWDNWGGREIREGEIKQNTLYKIAKEQSQ